LLLGSASGELLQQSSESLAGRIAYLELPPLQALELPAPQQDLLWLRGGFPDSFLARGERQSLVWRQNLISTYLERDIPSYGARIPAETLRRLWTMLAHNQGGLLDVSQLGKNLMIDAKTVHRYLDMLVDLMLLRRLQPWHSNVGKRLVKSPKLYVRDSGLVHALLGLGSHDRLLSHPVVGNSWEGFAVETLLNAAPINSSSGFYRTSNGAEVDLLLDIPGQGLWAIEIKRSSTAKPRRGFHAACEDLKPQRRWLVHGGTDRYPLGAGVHALGLRELAGLLQAAKV
jgi:predicted AAA+ superfamily ATPase